MFKRKIEKE